MPENQPILSASREAVSQLQSLRCLLMDLSSTVKSPEDRQRCQDLGRKVAQLQEHCKIESAIVKLCPKRLAIMEAFHQTPRRYSYFGLAGGNRCLGPDTLIPQPGPEPSRKVSEIKGDHFVWAWSFEENRLVQAQARQPFAKGIKP